MYSLCMQGLRCLISVVWGCFVSMLECHKGVVRAMCIGGVVGVCKRLVWQVYYCVIAEYSRVYTSLLEDEGSCVLR